MALFSSTSHRRQLYGTHPEIAALYKKKGLGLAAGIGWYTAEKFASVVYQSLLPQR